MRRYIDETTIMVQGGRGGNGIVSFFPNKGGPSGGNGGRGGDAYAVLDRQLVSLHPYVRQSTHKAHHGDEGGRNNFEGKRGADLELHFPPHTIITDKETGDSIVIDEQNPRALLCRGGVGGHGNNMFKSATNQVPHRATPGREGQKRTFHIVMKLLADYGLVGLPNAGKSSLLNQLTAAHAKVGAYPFTTLEPNLGVCNTKIIADIPGLIEGASQGKGLGTKFLKHIEKVTLLVHCIAADSDDVQRDYHIIMRELEQYSPLLTQKEQIILLTKVDLISGEERERKTKLLQAIHPRVYLVSLYDPELVKEVSMILN